MHWLILALALVAYREALRFSVERARELDAAQVERWFFIPDETAPVIVFVMAAWLLYRRRDRLADLAWEGGPLWLTVPLLAAGTAVFAWSTYTGAPDLLALSLCLNGLGLAALLGGAPAVRVVALPAVFLLFAIPLPAPLLTKVVWSFQIWTADYAGWLLFLIGQPALVTGDQILLPSQAFQVIETCSGLRSVETLSMLTVLMIDLFGRRGWHAAALFALAPFLAFALNGFRVLTLILNPHSEIAAIHNLQGIAVLLTGLTIQYGIDGLLERVLPARGAAPMAPSPSPPRPAALRVAAGGAAVLALISLAMPAHAPPVSAQPPLGDFVTEQIGSWEAAEELRLDPHFLERIGIRQKIFRRYENDIAPPIEVLIATGHHGNRFRSLFSPKSALPGSGWIIEDSSLVELEPDQRTAAATVVRRGTTRLLVLHWYENTDGLLDETLRTLLALDVSPLHRETEAIVFRLSTTLRGLDELERRRAERRLQRFYGELRTRMNDYAQVRRAMDEGGPQPEVANAANVIPSP